MELFVDIALYFTYLLLLGGVALALVFPLIQAVKQPSASFKPLIAIGGLALFMLITYFLASDTLTATDIRYGVDIGTSKLISAMVYSVYFCIFLAFVGIIYGEFAKTLTK